MTGELNLQGSFNIGVQGVAQGAEVNITQVLAKSYQYNDLVGQLELHKKLLALTPADQMQERLNLSATINSLESQIEQFKNDVLRLAEQFERIEINTDRLKRAKEHFDKGEIAEARAIFESESEAMQKDQNRLLEKRAEFEENILPKLRNNAEEYLLSALLSVTDYENPNRLAEAIEKFRLSIKSLETKQNLFQYATFLMILGHVSEAVEIYNQYLKKFNFELVGEEVINIYINLGQVYCQMQDFINAENYYGQALEILNRKESVTFPNYKFSLAAVNANFGILLQYQTKYAEAYKKYKESIVILAELSEKDSLTYLPTLADIQSNLCYLLRLIYAQDILEEKFDDAEKHYAEAEVFSKEAFRTVELFFEKNNLTLPLTLVNNALNYGNLLTEKNYFESARAEYDYALTIIEKYQPENPQSYLPKKALILNSLGVLKEREGKLDESQKYLEDALKIGTELIKSEPQTNFVPYCMFSVNLADSYCQTNTNRVDSINAAVEVAAILLPVLETLPYTIAYVQKAGGILKKWGFSDEEMQAMVEERIKQMQSEQSKQ